MTAYREWRPAGPVGALLECAWQSRTGADVTREQRVLPDGCMDLLLLGGRLVVAGPDTAAHTAQPAPGAVTTGLRFRPGALPSLLGVPAAELVNQRVPLSDLPLSPADMDVTVVGGAGENRGGHLDVVGSPPPGEMRTVAAPAAPGDRDAHLDTPRSARSVALGGVPPLPAGGRDSEQPGPVVSRGAQDRPAPDAALLLDVTARLAAAADDRRRPLPGPVPGWALRALAHGSATADVADRLGVTTRTLHRTCVATLGYGPSVARRVLRFRAAAALLYSGTAPADVAARTGYADQPHLSREVRALAGVSPSVLAAG